MTALSALKPKTLEGQMIAVLAISLTLLLAVITSLDLADRDTPIEWAGSPASVNRLKRVHLTLENLAMDRRDAFLDTISGCHEGYTLTARAFERVREDEQTIALAKMVARHLSLEPGAVAAGHARLTRADFSYSACSESEIRLPMNAVVVSVALNSGEWLNTEMHPHEWHVENLLAKIARYAAACIFICALAIFLMHRIGKPLNRLTRAARTFGEGLNLSPVPVSGPPDVKRAIESFNAMQQQVLGEVRRRSETLAAISHDLRTPLTALRIKAEMLDDDEHSADLIAGIARMERIIASGLDYLRGEARSEPMRTIDLGAMLASECSDFEEAGQRAKYIGAFGIHYLCRPEALARAVRNLIENSNKYASGATVQIEANETMLEISVADAGLGIPEDQFSIALEPFRRLSKAREDHGGGFGLGLAAARAIAQGHNGELILSSNKPSGLVATIRLPSNQSRQSVKEPPQKPPPKRA